MRVAIDTGGTFTDLVVTPDDGELRLYKTPTLLQDRVTGVLNGLKLAAADAGVSLAALLSDVDVIVHGTTTATNAIITSSTAKTAFLTTEGHPDVLVLREGGRMGAPLFDYSIPYPKPYVPRALTFEVRERMSAEGEVVLPLDEEALEPVLHRLRELEVEAVGVCLLWSVVNGLHENRVGELIQEVLPDVAVTLSHQINPTVREYRRASSACIDASLKPVMADYLRLLADRLGDAGYSGRVLVVTSQGSVRDARELSEAPIHTVMSGPAMAPVAGRYFANIDAAQDTAIVTDAGGTTYDVSLVRNGRIPETRETWLGPAFLGHMTGFPSIDVRSIGAGGGSIAAVDEAGMLSVGPESAGAEPGPACYRQGGTRPTLTDACLVLGFVSREGLLGGRMALSLKAATAAIAEHVAEPLDVTVIAAAGAILQVATENMALAIEDITVNQGIDPGTAILVGGGGAAGFNCVAIARRIGCSQVLIPNVGAVLSAAGALLSDLGNDYGRALVTTGCRFDRDRVNAVLADLSAEGEAFVQHLGLTNTEHRVEFAVEARYANQVWEIKLPLNRHRFDCARDVDDLCEEFHQLHEQIFAVHDGRADIEFLVWRARIAVPGSPLAHAMSAHLAPGGARQIRAVHFPDEGVLDTRVLRLHDVPDGGVVEGPAIVETPLTTVVVDAGSVARRCAGGSLLIDVDARTKRS